MPLRILLTFLAGFALCAHAQEPATADSVPPKRFTPRVVPKTGPPAQISAEIDGSTYALINGVTSTKEQCDSLANAVWAVAGDGSACIRYFAAGFPASGLSDKALVYFTGDVWDGRPAPGYAGATVNRLQASADERAAKVGLPFVLVARPGTYGSSGDHMQRRRRAESALLSAALDDIKTRLRVNELVAVGYSGGGHVVSSLISMRSDLICAVPIAAPASPKLRATLLNWTTDSTGYDDSYEPTEHLNKRRMHPALRVLVVGDPRDGNAVWPAQVILAEKLSSIEVQNTVVPVKGSGPRLHFGQGDIGLMIAAWCAQGLSFPEILSRVSAAQN